MARKFIIYGLIDPRTLELRYIGKSSSGLNRPKKHEYSVKRGIIKTHCQCWVKSLLIENYNPEIIIIEELDKQDELNEAEMFWISYFKMIGVNLTNMTDGGEGLYNPCDETRKKMRDAKLGKNLSTEHKKNIGAGNKGKSKIFTEQHKRNISRSLLGSKQSEEQKNKRVETRKKTSIRNGYWHSDETKLRMRKSQGRCVICNHDGREFTSIALAAEYYNVSRAGLRKSIVQGRPMRNGLYMRFK